MTDTHLAPSTTRAFTARCRSSLRFALALPLALTPALALTLAPAPAHAAEPVSAWQGPRATVTARHLMPAMKQGEGYADKYTFNADFEGGGDFYFSMTIGNLGFGDGKMEAKGRFTLGDKSYRWNKNLDDDEWRHDKKAFDVKAGPARLWGTPDKLEMSAKAKGAEIELSFTPIAPAWRPRDGQIRWGKDRKTSDYTVFPLMAVTGRYKLAGGDWQPLTGRGFGAHSWSELAPYDTTRWTMELRGIEGDTAVYLREVGATDAYGRQRVPYLLITKGAEILFESFDYELTPTETMTDKKHDNRYVVPESFTLLGKDASDPTRMVRGKVTKRKLRKRTEPLSQMNAAMRAVASQYSEPVNYDYDVEYAIEVKLGDRTERLQGVGRYEVYHLNK